MNFLGIGPMELLLIVTLALIGLGPEELPEVRAELGKAYSEVRRAATQLSDDFNRTLQAELDASRAVVKQTKEAVTEARSSVDAAVAGTRAALDGTAEGI